MCFNMCACRYTRGRFERTHGDVLNVHTGGRGSSSVLLTKICPRMVITCFRSSPKKLLDPSGLRIDREQHVPDSSNHSLYPVSAIWRETFTGISNQTVRFDSPILLLLPPLHHHNHNHNHHTQRQGDRDTKTERQRKKTEKKTQPF